MPPGLSAEHLGTHDCYHWDNLWSIAGLDEAAAVMRFVERPQDADHFAAERRAYEADLERSLALDEARLGRKAVPAAPGRRFDHGVIGGLCAVHPTKLWSADDPRVSDTIALISERFLVDDGFMHALIHSGTNAYLTLHVAQCFAAVGNAAAAWRCFDRTVAIASACGTWPEAVHPLTGGGCMGDGCHGWAAADLLLFLRDALVAEDGDAVWLTRIFRDDWRRGVSVRSAPTWFGEVSLAVSSAADGALVLDFAPSFRRPPGEVRWRLPGLVRAATVDGAPLPVRGNVVLVPPRACTVRAELVA